MLADLKLLLLLRTVLPSGKRIFLLFGLGLSLDLSVVLEVSWSTLVEIAKGSSDVVVNSGNRTISLIVDVSDNPMTLMWCFNVTFCFVSVELLDGFWLGFLFAGLIIDGFVVGFGLFSSDFEVDVIGAGTVWVTGDWLENNWSVRLSSLVEIAVDISDGVITIEIWVIGDLEGVNCRNDESENFHTLCTNYIQFDDFLWKYFCILLEFETSTNL